MKVKFKDLLSEQFGDVLNEDSLQLIEQAFEDAVNDKASSQFKIERENLIEKIDKDHSAKLQKLIEKIDVDHTAKVKKLVEAIDTDHAIKFQKVVEALQEKHKEEMTVKAKELNESLTSKISDYIDLYIDEVIPKQQISEAVENIRAKRVVEQIKKLVGIDESFIDGELKEALKSGKDTIDSLRAELNEAVKTNVMLEQRAARAESQILLSEKTEGMHDTKRDFVLKFLKNKTPDYIEENFSYVVDLYERESLLTEQQAREEVREQIETNQRLSIDRPVIKESVQEFSKNEVASETDDTVSSYLTEMQKRDKRTFNNAS